MLDMTPIGHKGSSPRMRGAPNPPRCRTWAPGIIPADAESTRRLRNPKVSRWDHPRGCGEHMQLLMILISSRGSSPRMRGALIWFTRSSHPTGIIPADAGSTAVIFARLKPKEDHPRGCGEHMALSTASCTNAGSSPRMRGAPMYPLTCHDCARIIPADAGSTHYSSVVFHCDRDHPRGCGEHPEQSVYPVWSGGSSPRMRGALLPFGKPVPLRGIIPADAGSTFWLYITLSLTRDHPRGCGEHVAHRMRPIMERGSSPRMRGAPTFCVSSRSP